MLQDIHLPIWMLGKREGNFPVGELEHEIFCVILGKMQAIKIYHYSRKNRNYWLDVGRIGDWVPREALQLEMRTYCSLFFVCWFLGDKYL